MIYVSPLYKSRQNKKWPYPYHCYLMADTLTGLHFFAARIGLKREWYQPKSTPHYDLTANKRTLAIKFGAKPLPQCLIVKLIQKIRENATYSCS